jgi:hypothetical protein
MIDLLSILGPVLNARNNSDEIAYKRWALPIQNLEQAREFNESTGLQRELGQGDLSLRRDLGMGDLNYRNRALTEGGRQFDVSTAEGRRQFDIASQERAREFDTTTAEGRRQFDAENALRRELGLGNLEISRGNLALQTGQLGLNRDELAQRGSQFGQNLSLQREQLEQQKREQKMRDVLAFLQAGYEMPGTSEPRRTIYGAAFTGGGSGGKSDSPAPRFGYGPTAYDPYPNSAVPRWTTYGNI